MSHDAPETFTTIDLQRYRYQTDPIFHELVDGLTRILSGGALSPFDLYDAVRLAITTSQQNTLPKAMSATQEGR